MADYKLNRRKFIGMTALAGAALASPAYIRRASASGGEVNIWTYNDFVPQSFKKQFESETGIKINIRLWMTKASSSIYWLPSNLTQRLTS